MHLLRRLVNAVPDDVQFSALVCGIIGFPLTVLSFLPLRAIPLVLLGPIQVLLWTVLALSSALLLLVGRRVVVFIMTGTLSRSFRTPSHVKSELKVRFLGLIPSDRGKPGSYRTHDKFLRNTMIREAIRIIRTNVMFAVGEPPSHDEQSPQAARFSSSLILPSDFTDSHWSPSPGRRGTSLVMTSSRPGEGESTRTRVLADALTAGGLKVTVVDADLRRPRIHEIFLVSNERGLSDVVGGQTPLQEAVQKTRSGTSVLPTGRIPQNPTELLASRRFRDLHASLKEHFDWVVFDTPPVGGFRRLDHHQP
jgi:Mrp family chromosome partitioning ATPase